jgi:hypothetical protein
VYVQASCPRIVSSHCRLCRVELVTARVRVGQVSPTGLKVDDNQPLHDA